MGRTPTTPILETLPKQLREEAKNKPHGGNGPVALVAGKPLSNWRRWRLALDQNIYTQSRDLDLFGDSPIALVCATSVRLLSVIFIRRNC